MFSGCLSVRPFICCQSYEHDILKTNEPISMKIGTSDPRGERIKRSTLELMRSKVKVTRGRNRSQKSLSA